MLGHISDSFVPLWVEAEEGGGGRLTQHSPISTAV